MNTNTHTDITCCHKTNATWCALIAGVVSLLLALGWCIFAPSTSAYAATNSGATTDASATSELNPAQNITDACTITLTEPLYDAQPISTRFVDGNYNSFGTLEAGTTITVETNDGSTIGGLYLIFNYIPESWTLTAGGTTTTWGTHGYLHEYVDTVGGSSATLTFPAETQFCDIYVLSEGSVPDWVQVWQPAEGRVDVLFCPTHADDDQLYLGGIVPTCINAGYTVQVVYLISHWTEEYRPHELLNSLWNNGLTRHPYMGYMRDMLPWSALSDYTLLERQGWSHDDVVGHQVELLRKYQPQIVVTHALNGEYGHPAHILNVTSMQEAVLAASDATQYPDSAQIYGTWDVPKTYIHLYEENQIVLDLDTPLEKLGGRTAFQIMQESFAMHKSQMKWDDFRNWLFTRNAASEIPYSNYGPCYYGLWRSTVGADTLGNTMFENITSYADQEIAAAQKEQRDTLTRNIVICLAVLSATIGGVMLRRRKKS